MNKKSEKITNKNTLFAFVNGRVKDLLLIGVLAIVLFYAAWKIFRGDAVDKTVNEELQLTETEVKVMRLLQEIDGVGEASVIVCESEDSVKSVVVVCEGANDLRVVMNVREAVAAALDTEQKSIKIYLKKE